MECELQSVSRKPRRSSKARLWPSVPKKKRRPQKNKRTAQRSEPTGQSICNSALQGSSSALQGCSSALQDSTSALQGSSTSADRFIHRLPPPTELVPSASQDQHHNAKKTKLAVSDSDSCDASMTVPEWRRDFSCNENSHRTLKDKNTDREKSGALPGDYYCNGCSNVITGRRYTCVQCADMDLCATCEAAGLHALHYVLRVPGGRPEEEVTSVLERIREELFKLHNTVESIEIQIKEEPDPLDIHIDAMTSTLSHPMNSELRTNVDMKQTDSEIQNKIELVKVAGFVNFRHQSPPDQSTAQLISTAPSSGNPEVSALPDVEDIKLEPGVADEARCAVFVHGAGPQTAPQLCARSGSAVAADDNPH